MKISTDTLAKITSSEVQTQVNDPLVDITPEFVLSKIFECESFLDELEEGEGLFVSISQELSEWELIKKDFEKTS